MNIVLVHGIYNTGRIFFKMRRAFKKNGYKCFAPNLKPSDGRYGIDDLGIKLEKEINKNIGEDTQFVLVGFSMGGIVSRYYLQELGGFKRIKQFFTISTPHYGSYLAYLYPGEGAKHLRPNSQFLKNLEVSESLLKNIELYSYWTPFDLSIIPSANSKWRIAENKKFFSPLHPLMVFNRKLIDDIIKLIASSNQLIF